MTTTRRFATLLFSLALIAGMAKASNVTLLSAGNGTGLSDGTYYVGLVDLTIDGENYKAMCIDSLHRASVGDKWTGVVTPLTDTEALALIIRDQFWDMTPDVFNPKLRADAIAYFMMLDNSDDQSVIDLQHGAWGQFDDKYEGAPLAALAALRLSNRSMSSGSVQTPFSIDNFSLVTDSSHVRQAFIIYSTPDPAPDSAPEPVTLGLMGTGLVLVGLLRRRGCK